MQSSWAMEPGVLGRMLQILERRLAGEQASPAEIAAVVAQREERRRNARAAVAIADDTDEDEANKPTRIAVRMEGDSGSVAVIPVDGVISKYASMINGASQPQGVATAWIADALRKCATDPRCASILLQIDSPGGTVAGCQDVVAAVRECLTLKPIVALAHDQMCSAAYLIGSAAGEVCLGPQAMVGSIGVYQIVEDTSDRAEKSGVIRHVVRSGARKGIGVAGTEVTAEQLGAVQEEVDAMFRAFVADVAAGRGLSLDQVMKIADGRVLVGADAVAAGLADSVTNYAALVARMDEQYSTAGGRAGRTTSRRMGGGNPAAAAHNHTEDPNMTTPAPSAPSPAAAPPSPAAPAAPQKVAATIAELKAAFADNPAFALDCAEKGLSLIEAKAAHADVLAAELATTKAALAEAKKAPPAPPAPGTVVTEAATSGKGVDFAAGGSSHSDYETAVKHIMATDPRCKGKPKVHARAIAAMVISDENPKLHNDHRKYLIEDAERRSEEAEKRKHETNVA